MKVYRLDRGIVLVGKAWEIREKLKQYEREFKLVKDWVNSIPSSKL
ncbi:MULTISPECIES: Z-ring formation inhibitor MciZ [Priestia]|uniref:Z-ring formation inhibitor MciZ n=2 Tax=Priestia endophytica TaxID=135735 RepID=A0A329EY41_9BACI|nr:MULTISPECIES: Z-ring formation inhibitor MciZ [Priestia]KAB2493701.1 Z-ring formation inhibitor MciZ [Priestia endophytica]MCM3539494.1 Z-ring formation inhibitor MciZ [Priestia endophytica]MCY8232827.1 Z-ring formation inhibitor MciZ [Priestia endophytica]MDT3764292.1 Z-ring formation inhibitor MciZ [Priestia filamentosa]MED3725214.1 Z-ring formation inhibitor MciZ [Priestia filamentosa]